jgi:hypothetical protein
MSSDQLTNQRNGRHDAEIDIDEEASTLLGRWFPLVGALPKLIGAKQHKAAVRELIAWYEHVLADDGYCADPPIQGLDALVDELVHVSVSPGEYAELAKGRSAIRVAEELASWRRCFRDHEASSVPIECAADRLAQAIIGARSHFADDWRTDH